MRDATPHQRNIDEWPKLTILEKWKLIIRSELIHKVQKYSLLKFCRFGPSMLKPTWWAWGGDWRPSWWGPLNILPQISIFGHYLTPQKRENSPRAISNQSLTEKKNLIFSGTFSLIPSIYSGTSAQVLCSWCDQSSNKHQHNLRKLDAG